LQILDAEDLALRFRARRKVFADAFAVDSGIDLKNDFPGGIREFCDDVWIFLLHDRFGRSTAKSAVRKINSRFDRGLNGGEGGIRTLLLPRG
jgi:hypothetical protein